MSKQQLFKCDIQQNYQELMHQGGEELQKVVNYEGDLYRTPIFWQETLKSHLDLSKPLNYVEVGTYHGGNLLHFIHYFNINEVVACDPYIDYADYKEYLGQQDKNYQTFQRNFSQVKDELKAKVNFIKDYSHNVLPSLQNNYYDVIYLDGNHDKHAVLEDAILAWRKLKVGGILIFDDYGWADCNVGIDTFIINYNDYLKIIYCQNCQIMVKKTSDFATLSKTQAKLQPKFI